MGSLSLTVCGPYEVRHAGQSPRFRTRKALALLLYLAIEGGAHSREKLIARFWPNSDRQHGRTMLRTTITYLRDALDGDPAPAHLVVEREALSFDRSSVAEFDLRVVEAAFALLSAPLDNQEACLAQLERALRCYRGELLEGFALEDAPEFEEWLRLQREAWHYRISSIFEHLTQRYSESGSLAPALDLARRWIAVDPWNERAYQQLIRLHLASGDRIAALRAYTACRDMLAAELHTTPSPETEALAGRLQAPLPLEQTRDSPPARIAIGPERPATPPALPDGPLVGRSDELARLMAIGHAARRGQSQVALLIGEAGIGKTRLASEFLAWSHAQGADVLHGRAFETSAGLLYQPLVESLRPRIERENAPVDLLSDVWLAELSRLLPELRDRYPDLPPPTADESTARIRLYEAVARLVQALAARAPVVLAIDDLHWADAASLDLLHYLGRRWREEAAPILLLFSVRSEALATTPALAAWLKGVEHDLGVTRIQLGPLQQDDSVRMVAALAGQRDMRAASGEQAEAFGRWLFDETRGQPFYMREMLKALLERDLVRLSSWAGGGWAIDIEAAARHLSSLRGLVPASVRELIRSRLAQLPPAANTLLAAGAILDHDFTFEQLCRVAGLDEQTGLVSLDDLLRSGHLTEGRGAPAAIERSANARRPSLPGVYNFTHEKIRNVVYTEAGDARRRVFQRRALLARQDAPPAIRAYHAREAGLLEPAFQLSVQAGNAALRLFAVRDAITHYEQARELAGDTAIDPSNAAMRELYSQLGRAYELDNQTAQAREVYQSLLALARQHAAPALECVALNRLATLAVHERYDLEEANQLLHAALRVADALGESVELAETHWNLAQLHLYRLDPHVHRYAERALELARRLGLRELIARNLNILIYADVGFGRWSEAETRAAEACSLFRAMENRAMEADCLCQAASAQINLGRPREGIVTAQTAHAISASIENVWGVANSSITLAQGLLEIGAYGEALASAERGLQLARACGMGVMVLDALLTLGNAQRAILDLDAARAYHHEALALGEPTGIDLVVEIIAAELCADYALAGAWDQAHAFARRAMAERTYAVARTTQLALWHQTEALARAGQLERAEADAHGYGQRLGGSPRYQISYLRARAVLAMYHGERARALDHLQSAAGLAEQLGLPGEQWPILAQIGILFEQQGDLMRANDVFRRAATILHTLAASLEHPHQRDAFLAAPQARFVLERGA